MKKIKRKLALLLTSVMLMTNISVTVASNNLYKSVNVNNEITSSQNVQLDVNSDLDHSQ